MQKRKITFRTCWQVTSGIASSTPRSLLLCAAAFGLCAQAPSPSPTLPAVSPLVALLNARAAALRTMGVREPASLEETGIIAGLGLQGTFHQWHQGDDDRFDQDLGVREEQSVRVGDRQYVVNASGNVRLLTGSLERRQRTQDFIFSDDFMRDPQYATLVGPATLPDGRRVMQVRVAPPGGDVETVAIDDRSKMIDRIAYTDADGISTNTYSGYHVVHGALVAYTEVDSNGDSKYDITQTTRDVHVGGIIAPATFAVPVGTTVPNEAPVTVKLTQRNGHIFVPVTIRGKHFNFLVDTGSQGVVVDSNAAASLVLLTQGLLEVRGANRVGGEGVAPLDSIDIGGVNVPVRVVSVVDLSRSTDGLLRVGGVLGSPFFASAEVRLNLDAMTMTFGKPGSLPPLGEKLPLDTDRQLPEVAVKINGVSTQALMDTGNNGELLLFAPFVAAHPGIIPFSGFATVRSYGVGGSNRTESVVVDELDIGSYRLFQRRANFMQATRGAFADRIDGGNVGLRSLRNFIVTFDMANRAVYLAKAQSFDDGRYREEVMSP